MDAVSAGASVLAFAGLALQSAKTISEIISSIRDGPKEVDELGSAVRNLQSVLEQVSATPTRGAEYVSEADFRLMSTLVENCKKDVLAWEAQLAKVRPIVSTGATGKIWKRIKTVLREKDLQRIRDKTDYHITELGVQLNIIQSKTSLSCKDDLVHLRSAVSERAINDQTQISLLRQHRTDLTVIGEKMESSNNAIQHLQGDLQEAVSSITQQMVQIPQTANIQLENIGTLLQALQEQVRGLSSGYVQEQLPKRRKCDHREARQEEDPDDSDDTDEILESMKRLSNLARQEEGYLLHGQATYNLLDDLDRIVNYASANLSPQPVESSGSKKRPFDATDNDGKIDVRELKRLQGLLTSAHSLAVNKGAQCLSHKGKRIIQRYTNTKISTKYATIDITRRTRNYSAPKETSSNGMENTGSITEVTNTIKAMLTHQTSQAMLTISVHQNTMSTGFMSLSPRISVGCVVPQDSPIFDLVKSGDLQEFQKLVSEGEASIRTYTSCGKPLLHYATEQPEMCRFLIEHGADVDEIGPWSADERTLVSALTTHIEDDLEDNEGNEIIYNKRNECRRILLNAGADPVTNSGSTSDAIRRTILYGKYEESRMLLQLGAEFIGGGLNQYLLMLAQAGHNAYFRSKCDLLIKHGSSLQARDEDGRTCLHISLENVWYPEDDNEKTSLEYLVRKGADIFAVDNLGRSVSTIAYTSKGQYGYFGSYPGDLWDAVLSECGYDISNLRKWAPRRPQYNNGLCLARGQGPYTREDFERLWEGREELCPYYDDPPRWPPRSESESELESDTESEGENESEEDEYLEEEEYLEEQVGSEEEMESENDETTMSNQSFQYSSAGSSRDKEEEVVEEILRGDDFGASSPLQNNEWPIWPSVPHESPWKSAQDGDTVHNEDVLATLDIDNEQSYSMQENCWNESYEAHVEDEDLGRNPWV